MGVLNLHHQSMHSDWTGGKPWELLNPSPAGTQARNLVHATLNVQSAVCCSQQAMVGREKVFVRDVIFANVDGGIVVGEVHGFLSTDGIGLALVQEWTPVGESMFLCHSKMRLLQLSSNVAPCIFRRDGNHAFVIPPFTLAREYQA